MIAIVVVAVLGLVVIALSMARVMRALKAVETETVRAAQEVARLRQQVERGNGSPGPGLDAPSS